MGEITQLLHQARDGSPDAMQAVFACLYDELHALAGARAGRLVAGATLGATELVHETYLKLIDAQRLPLQDRRHFLVCAARAMRQIMVDRARSASAQKRGGAAADITLTDLAGDALDLDVLDVDRALRDLAEIEPGLLELVELRFFAGLEMAELARLRGVSERTAHREWQRARALLAARLGGNVA